MKEENSSVNKQSFIMKDQFNHNAPGPLFKTQEDADMQATLSTAAIVEFPSRSADVLPTFKF